MQNFFKQIIIYKTEYRNESRVQFTIRTFAVLIHVPLVLDMRNTSFIHRTGYRFMASYATIKAEYEIKSMKIFI
jgi:hypothetical protein